MFRIALSCFLFFSFSLFAEEEIIVHLSSQIALRSVYLYPFEGNDSGFESAYLKQLEGVMKFDLGHNGHTELVASHAADYVVKVSVAHHSLSTSLLIKNAHTEKKLDGVLLTGDLARDRRIIHQIADVMHESLFGTPGVASRHILYTVQTRKSSDSNQWVSDVWQCDYDGANARQVTKEGALCVTPTYLPAHNGKCRDFLYVSYKIGQPKIVAGNLESGSRTRLTYLRGNQLMPAISYQRDKIAFISDITGNPDLFVQDYTIDKGLLGKPRQIFCAPQATQGTPSFSPNGREIAFVSNKDGTPRIYIIDIPRGGTSLKDIKPLMISKRNRENTSPAWSPDGKKIAYSALTSGVRQIWIYDIATKKEIQLTDGNGHKENPAWAADSLHLCFNSSTAAGSELYLINLNQKKAFKISNGPGEKRFPTWEPFSPKVETKL